MVTQSTKWPLLIDPQGQGVAWIKKRDEANRLRVTSLGDKRFRNALEDSMAFGEPLLLENVEEELDPILDPVLDKAIQKSGRGFKVVLADKECEYAETFRFYMTTKLGNPHFTPELCAQVAVINFTVTMSGLEQQLLGRVVLREKPELEEQRQSLVESVNSNRKTLKQLEDDLLYRLANSTGNLLDDASLIEVLQSTKTTSADVKEKLANAAEAETRIALAREEYRPVATRGALLYFLITDMAAINPMYQVSLQQFLVLFDYSIASSDRAPVAKQRISNIIDYLSFHTTCYIQRGLFERHKTIWTLMFAMKVQQVAGHLQDTAVQLLLKGGAALDLAAEKPKPFAWLPDKVWLNVLALSRGHRQFSDLPDSLNRNDVVWKHWYDEDAPESAKVPDYDDRCTTFDKMLLVRCIREDRTLLCVDTYISETLGRRYIDSRPLDLRAVEEEASALTPIVALLSQGADPTAPIMELARKKKKAIKAISMGQGQEPAARKLIAAGVTAGSWVLLQNCHLGLRFVSELERSLHGFEEIQPDFRLWVTTEPHPKFPIGLLQMSIKITNEAPAGVRAGLKASYNTTITQDTLDAVSMPQWKSMLYALAFMHTIVQERRKFGPLGFNVPYEFNQSDLSASVQFMQNHLNDMETKKRPVDWIVINYMVCDVQYGGRITDDWDRRLFNTYGQAWLAPRILEGGFEFYPGYRVAPGTDSDGYKKFVEGLPLIDDPGLFGLHSNADLVFRTAQTADVLGTVLDIQPKEGGGGGGATREELVLAQVEELMTKLPADFKGDEVKVAIRSQGGPKPLNICLQQEVDRLQKVLTVVRSSLANLKLAIAGTIVMSPDLSNALDALFMARVPAAWAKASQLQSPSLGVWFGNILQRQEQLAGWLKSGRPHCFWLTGFFNPQGFLTANRQEVCRKHAKENWALDDVVNLTKVVNMEKAEVRRPPDEGIYVHGLFLDGCKWDKPGNKLVDSTPKVIYSELPVLLVTGCLAAEKKADAYSYACPCYANPKRGGLNFIFTVDLRSEDPPQKWILRGVALLASTA
jgi:dynein heavy chain